MAKSLSPKTTRSRPKTKIPERKGAASPSDKATGDAKPRSKSRGRVKSRGSSPASKTNKDSSAKSRKSSTSRKSTSKARTSRARSQSRQRKSEPKSRSVSRKSVSRKSVSEKPAPEETDSAQPRQRRSETSKLKPITSAAPPSDVPLTRSALASLKASSPSSSSSSAGAKPSRALELLHKSVEKVKGFGYGRTFAAAFWLVSLPAFVLGLHLLCSKDHCYVRFNPTIPKTLRVYADPLVIGYGAGLVALQVVLSALPVGRLVPGFSYRRLNQQYRSNSLMCLVLSVALYCFAVFYLRLPNMFVLHAHRFKCVSAATVLSLIIAALLYVKSFTGDSSNANHGSPCAPGIQNNFLHDFVHGRECSPRIGRTLDLGLVLVRTSNCIWVFAILAMCFQARSANGPVFGLTYSVALVAAMQLIYVFLGSLNEVFLLKSAFIQQGVGFLYVFSTITLSPFCSTLPLRYLVDGKVADLCVFCYPAIALCFIVGVALIHYSNALKYNSARVGGKTTRDGPWSFVRHPNYLGELLCILAWTLPCGKAVLPYGHLIFASLLVVCRSIMAERHTTADYRNYQQQVRYRVLPPIF